MENKYIINDVIVFDVNCRVLTLFCDEDHVDRQEVNRAVLHTPTANCLEQLIINHGKILSREQLLESVWKKNGMVVSPGTVYQNISLMRRSFSQLGLIESVIETVPRQGVMLSASVKVVRYQSRQSPVDNRPSLAINESKKSTQQTNKKRFFDFVSASSIAITAILGATAFTIGHVGQTDYMSDYQAAGVTKAGCKIYLNENFPVDKFREVMGNSRLACKIRPYNYVTVYSGVNRYSIISCASSIKQSRPDCRSQFYLEGVT